MRPIVLFSTSMFALLISSPAFALVSLHLGGMTVTFNKIHVGLLVLGLLLVSSVFAYRFFKAR